MQQNEFSPVYYTILKINAKWIKGFSLKLDTIKLLEEDIGSIPLDISFNNNFLNLSSGKGNKSKNKQMGVYQMESFFSVKKSLRR